jgi:hypothetical protein
LNRLCSNITLSKGNELVNVYVALDLENLGARFALPRGIYVKLKPRVNGNLANCIHREKSFASVDPNLKITWLREWR